MADFPTVVTTNGDPSGTSLVTNPGHAEEHQSHNAEIKATQTKLGTGASTPAANKLLYATGTGTSAWQGLTSSQLAAILSDETGTGAAVFGTAPTISAPVVSTGTFASPVLTTPAVITSINDANGNEVIKTPATGSAVNEITITNAATGNAPSIAPTGNDSAINLNLKGKGLAKTITIGGGAVNIFPYDYVASGCVWTADAAGSTRLASMTAGVVVIGGNPLTVAAVTSRTFTASKDVYVDVLDNGDGTGLLVYTDGTTNAASGALASNSLRLAIIVVGASSIAAAASVNQGQEDRVLPIASSIPYAVTDSLGNLICPRDPGRKLLGYRQIIATFTAGAATLTDVTGLNSTVMVPISRKIKVKFWASQVYSSVDADRHDFKLYEDGVEIQASYNRTWSSANGGNGGYTVERVYTPASAGAHTYKVAVVRGSGTGVANVFGAAANPAFIEIGLY